MRFNPDTSKQAQETILFLKNSHPLLRFNSSIVLWTPFQKSLGIFLDAWITLKEHLKVITTQVNKTIWLLQIFKKKQKQQKKKPRQY